MATLERRQNRYRIVLRLNGKKFSRSIQTECEIEAQGALARINDSLRRIELGLLVPPSDADVINFLFSDGRTATQAEASSLRSLKQLFAAFFASILPDSIEDSTLSCLKTHASHLQRILGRRLLVSEIQQSDLNCYATKRLKENGRRGARVSPVTVRKELYTLRAVWNWAREHGHVQKALPLSRLRLPKTTEKLPFMTMAEVNRRLRRGGLSKDQEAALWDSVFLPLNELQELLAHVEATACGPVIFPLLAFAAYTGARRSEIIRCKLDDLDLEGRTVTIHEKKRVPGELTTRRVPLAHQLVDALVRWLTFHPGGMHTFAVHPLSENAASLSPRQMHRLFRKAVNNSKWHQLRGWHVFRHSYCSNCAARGIDQRIINTWVGHQTEAMVKRYRHLIPNQELDAIKHVFG